MLIAGVGYWVAGLPLGALLAFYFGLGGSGIWIGLVSGLTAVAVLLTGRWMRRNRRQIFSFAAAGALIFARQDSIQSGLVGFDICALPFVLQILELR